ncbi:ArsR/SmtB family transcription factor [Methanosarcina sp.]|uniref:ArsR/SmtB family transcription factor n=1 Tax=Methanosarcina sp. TaxID=2213 RepID=UPI003C730357
MSIFAYTHIWAVVCTDIVYIFKALADENRIRILNLLKNGELCVCDIEAVLGIKQSNASRHLNKLKTTGIIVSEKKSQWVYYQLRDDVFIRFPFLSMVIDDEIEKIGICKDDLALLEKLKASGRSCN